MKNRLSTSRRLITIAAAAIAGLAISSAAYAATATTATPAAARSVPACSSSDIGAWVAIDQANGAAGTFFYPLQFTNLSGHTCYLYGYPGVSAISQSGRQLGSPADWGSMAGARVVILAPGATAHTILAYRNAAVTTEIGCDPVSTMASLRIFLPGQYQPTYAEFELEACSRPGVRYLTVWEPIRAGVGTING
jgi:Protein of unknown function (DUF4232)